MERAIVTGGAGFIGSHLCGALLGKGCEVICIDNLLTANGRNLEELKGNGGFKFIKRDVAAKPTGIGGKIDMIFNLASPASPADYLKYPIETMLANSLGARNMLEVAVRKKSRFVQASTSEIYGDPLEFPQKETYWGNVNPSGVRSCYDESKRFAEALCMGYSRKRKADVRIARIFNTYGPGMRRNDGRVIPNFITQAVANKPITIYGDGSQTRSFCYVSDMVAGLMKLAETDAAEGEAVNLGNPHEISILQAAEQVKKICKSKSKIEFLPLPPDDPHNRQPDISKARKLLGWEPRVKLEDGLGRTVEYFRGKREARHA